MACLQAFSSSSPASGPLRQSQTLASLLRRCQRTQCRRRRPQTLLPPRGVWPRDVHILLLPQCRKHCLLFLREKFRLFSRLPSGWTPILLERILRQFSSRMVAGEMAVPRPRRPWRRSRSSVKLGIRCAINDISNSGFDVPAGMPKVVEEAPAPPAPGEPSVRRRRPHGPSDHSCGKEFAFKVYGMESNPINILEEIVWNKDEEITKLKDLRPLSLVQPAIKVSPPARDFVGALRSAQVATGAPGLIAEVKKASPSRGVLRADFDPVKIAQAYEAGGAACISVLCDAKYFQGSYDYLQAIRLAGVKCPLLCKEFIIDAYQISLARSKGADAILLIAAVLPNVDLSYFIKVAKSMGMSALVEVHTAEELDRVLKLPNLEFVGINNRDLGTFKVDIHNTVRLLEGERGQAIRDRGILVVGESGLFTPDDIKLVQDAGCGAVLVGESIVKKDDPTAGIKELYGKDIRR
eukprot:jgi/Mesvir1/1941/Mv22961-RA.2